MAPGGSPPGPGGGRDPLWQFGMFVVAAVAVAVAAGAAGIGLVLLCRAGLS